MKEKRAVLEGAGEHAGEREAQNPAKTGGGRKPKSNGQKNEVVDPSFTLDCRLHLDPCCGRWVMSNKEDN